MYSSDQCMYCLRSIDDQYLGFLRIKKERAGVYVH